MSGTPRFADASGHQRAYRESQQGVTLIHSTLSFSAGPRPLGFTHRLRGHEKLHLWLQPGMKEMGTVMAHWADRYGVGDLDLLKGGYLEHAVTPGHTVQHDTLSFIFKVCGCCTCTLITHNMHSVQRRPMPILQELHICEYVLNDMPGNFFQTPPHFLTRVLVRCLLSVYLFTHVAHTGSTRPAQQERSGACQCGCSSRRHRRDPPPRRGLAGRAKSLLHIQWPSPTQHQEQEWMDGLPCVRWRYTSR